MKIAYLVLTHDNPAHLHRLINTLRDADNDFYIHVDKKIDIEKFKLNKEKNVIFLEGQRVSCTWGDYSLVQATLNLMHEVVARKIEYDYLILLSGACYPLKSNSYIAEFLDRNNGKQFIEAFSFPNIEFDKLSMRLDKYWYPACPPFRQYKLRLQNILIKYLPSRDYLKVLNGQKPYTGSQWWALTNECASYILDYVRKNSKIVGLFKTSSCPDEAFFQTILMNSKFKKSISHKITFTEWEKKKWSPNTITIKHLELLNKKIILDASDNNSPNKKEEVLFARKFGVESLEVLDRIDLIIRSDKKPQ
jgi:hypothetical protein